MKTKKEILQGKYTIISNGKEIVFNNDTPKATAKKIVELHNNDKRIVLDYGSLTTLKSWGETLDVTGKIGMSKGYYDLLYPIIVHNKNSMGGTSILPQCILSIRESKGKKLIFEHKN